MANYKYTVANKEGKKLSGTIQANSETEARSELNNLGFSILALKESNENEATRESKSNKFIFEALDKNGKNVTGTIASSDKNKAFSRLKSEYQLTVTAIWPENAPQEVIEEARKNGTANLKAQLQEATAKEKQQAQRTEIENEKLKQSVKRKIEHVLSKINELLKNLDKDLEEVDKNEVNKKIDKVLRIKNSNNFDYILKTAEELLNFIQSLEVKLQKKGLANKRLKLKVQTQSLLKDLNEDTTKPKSLSEDIVNTINRWQQKISKNGKGNFLLSITNKIKNAFKKNPEVEILQLQIKTYNKQIFEFYKLYFQEPTPEYKEKVKNAIKTIKKEKKKAKEELKNLKDKLKNKDSSTHQDSIAISFIKELNSLTGWLLSIYLSFYFVGLYLNNKDFGFNQIPAAFNIYESVFFKYILVIIFLIHSYTALKINFFKKQIIADLVILPLVFIGSIVTLINF